MFFTIIQLEQILVANLLSKTINKSSPCITEKLDTHLPVVFNIYEEKYQRDCHIKKLLRLSKSEISFLAPLITKTKCFMYKQ